VNNIPYVVSFGKVLKSYKMHLTGQNMENYVLKINIELFVGPEHAYTWRRDLSNPFLNPTRSLKPA